VDIEICGYFEQYITAGTDNFTCVSIPATGSSGMTGGPSLPYRGIEVEISHGINPEIENVSIETADLVMGEMVCPAQPVGSDCGGPAPQFTIDPDQYSSTDLVPTKSVTIQQTGIEHGRRLSRIALNPVQYRPATGEILFVTSLEFDVVVTDGTPVPTSLPLPLTGVGPDYLIIVADTAGTIASSCVDGTEDQIERFVNWKQRKGFRVDVVGTSLIPGFSSTSPETSDGAVAAYISDVYQDSGGSLSYVLLIGDAPYFIPSNLTSKLTDEDDPDSIFYYYSDWIYSYVDGSDDIPDIAIGRLPVDTGAECAATLRKILAYDMEPDLVGGWYERNLLASYYQDDYLFPPQVVESDGQPAVCTSNADCDQSIGEECITLWFLGDRCVVPCTVSSDCAGLDPCLYSSFVCESYLGATQCLCDQDCHPEYSYLDITQNLHDFFDEATARETYPVLASNNLCGTDGYVAWSQQLADTQWVESPLRYDEDSDYLLNENDQRDAIQYEFETTTIGLAIHRDHGTGVSPVYWYRPQFYRIDAASLSNAVETPVVLSMNCGTGRFVRPDDTVNPPVPHTNDCIAEAFVTNPNGGAVAVIAPTETTNTSPNNLLTQGFIGGVWNYGMTNVHATTPRLEELMHSMREYLFDFEGSAWMRESHAEKYHIFGDPEMEYRPTTPAIRDEDFSHAHWVDIEGDEYTVHGPGDLNHALVALTQDVGSDEPRLLGRGMMIFGTADVELVEPPVLGPVRLTVTHHKMTPYEAWLEGCYSGSDCDDDGVPDSEDNCLYIPNADQKNCDHDDKGDICDDDICVDFCGDEVDDWASSSSSFFIGGGTPYLIGVHYCTTSSSIGDGDPTEPWSDVQLRWCDCHDFPAPEGEIPQLTACSADTFANCRMNEPQQDSVIQFDHERWHMASYSPQTEPLKPEASPQPDPTSAPNVTYYPALGCFLDSSWSYWSEDNDGTGWYTYHCGPEWTQYDDPNGTVPEKSTGWQWQEELWWKNQLDAIAPSYEPDEHGPGWGYLWVRPKGTAIASDPGVRLWTEANNYRPYRLKPWTWSMNPIIKKRLPRIFDDLPVINLPDPVDAPMIEQTFPMIRDVQIGLYAVAPESATDAGEYAYGPGLVGSDAAIAGLIHILVDGRSLDIGAWGYGTGSTQGSVPDTTGFASARFGWTESPDVPGSGDVGLAAFGGELATGAKSDRLWIGRFDGLDRDGIPYFLWEDATPSTGPLPPARSGAVLVPDDAGQRLLLVGGTLDDGSVASDLWEYGFARETWSIVSSDFRATSGADATMFRGRAYFTGGVGADSQPNTKVFRFDATAAVPKAEEVGDMAEGPGARDGMALGFAAVRAGSLIVYGGSDTLGIGRTDLWEYDMGARSWTQRLVDCEGRSCPPAEPGSFILANERGLSIGLYATHDEAGNAYFKTSGDLGWVGSDTLAGPPPAMDCDGDGEVEFQTAQVCRSSDEWYADVGRLACGEPGSGEFLCSAGEPTEMVEMASWSPGGWEWIVDLEAGPEGYSYVLADGTLYTFDTWSLEDGLQPIDQDGLEIPGTCWWCGGSDWGNDVEVDGDHLYLATWGGLHVFSLEKPWNPQEVAFVPGHGPASDVEVHGRVAYLADGLGITVLDLYDPTVPVERKRLSFWTPAQAIGAAMEEGRLYALKATELRSWNIAANPFNPVPSDTESLAGLLFERMRVEGRWIYLNGLWTQTLYDDPAFGLSKKGQHDLRPWVSGRLLRDGRAERTKNLTCDPVYEVWEEVE